MVEALDPGDIIGDGELMRGTSCIYEGGLAKREEDILNLGLASSYPHFKVKDRAVQSFSP